jgi:hypothetical protein
LRTLFGVQQPDCVRRRLGYGTVAFLLAMMLAAGGLSACARAARPETSGRRGLGTNPSTSPRPSPSSTPTPPLALVPTATATPGPSSTPTPSSPTAQMAALAASLPPGSVSVAARNLDTGASLTFGSSGGQIMASAVKVDILATLLLQLQASGGDLTDDEDSEATAMIEDSDDDAADDLWNDIGGGAAVAAANDQLGVPCTDPGSGPYWGLTTSCARGQIQLLDQLERQSSPLDQSSRAYILNLMENVTPSQVWGVPVVADSGTDFAVKDGWLNTNGDTDWAVNSDGIITYDGQMLLIAALSQNNDTVYDGVDLVQQLAQVAAQAVAS